MKTKEEMLFRIEFLEAAINAIADPVFVKDKDHRWIVVNDAFAEFMGHPKEELIGKSDYDFLPKNQADVFWSKDTEVFASNCVNENEETLTNAKGETKVIVTRKNPFMVHDGSKVLVACIRDISELRKQQEINEMQSRLASLGEMVGGIAHEINNPLAVVKGKLDVMRKRLETGKFTVEKLTNDIDSALESCKRLQNAVSSMQRVARGDNSEPTAMCRVRELLEGLRSLSSDYAVRHGIKLDIDCNSEEDVLCRSSEVLQVLINLVNNSVHAVSESEDKWITVSSEIGPQGQSKIRITDSGKGIPVDLQKRIFEPFFTTKNVGVGTGLGLSISKKIMKMCEGDLYYETHKGHTSFVLEFSKVKRSQEDSI